MGLETVLSEVLLYTAGTFKLESPSSMICKLAVLAVAFWLAWQTWNAFDILVHWMRTDRLMNKSNIPQGPSRQELRTAMKAHGHHSHRLWVGWANKYGPIYRVAFLHKHLVSISEPALASEVMRRTDVFDKSRFGYDAIDMMTSPHGRRSLLSQDTGDYWRLIRKGVMPAFSAGNLKLSFPGMQKLLTRLVAYLKSHDPKDVLDIDNITCRETLDVIGRVGFDKDMGALSSMEPGSGETTVDLALACTEEVERYMMDFFRSFRWWRPDVWKGKKEFRKFHKVLLDLLAEVKGRGSGIDPRTIAGHLLRIKDPKTGQQLPDEAIAAEIGIFFFAGFDTTGHTLSWTLYLVSQHPQVEAKVAAELASHGLLATSANPSPRPVEWDDLGKLTYLNAVVKESMRYMPVAAGGTGRCAKADVILAGKYLIPKGADVSINLMALLMSDANWEDANAFRPERFLEEGAELARSLTSSGEALSKDEGVARDAVPGSSTDVMLDGTRGDGMDASTPGYALSGERAVKRFLPFSEGPRSCAGMSLAKVNVTATLATLLGNFTFRLADEMEGPEGVRKAERMAITLSSSKGMKMHCIPRAALEP